MKGTKLEGDAPDLMLDVSRLIWRAWRGGLPTGIDRVCLAYVRHFGGRSLAVIQRGGFQMVLSQSQSARLFAMLAADTPPTRAALGRRLLAAVVTMRTSPPRLRMIYLNVGHTGLNEPTLPRWIRKHDTRAVYMVHDLIPITHPQYCREGEADAHRNRIENALSSAAGIIGNSRTTLDELADFAAEVGKPMPPAHVAWLCGTPAQRTPKAASHRPYFLALGTIEARKNHQLLLDVWRRLVSMSPAKVPDLLIVGQRGWEAEEVFHLLDQPQIFRGHVRELNRCDDLELGSLLAGARALLMPSFAEGFGLPVVEALEMGTPVVASDLPVFREIAGEIPLYLDPTDAGAWLEAIRLLQEDGEESRRQRAAMRHFQAPSWEDHFRSVEGWLATL